MTKAKTLRIKKTTTSPQVLKIIQHQTLENSVQFLLYVFMYKMDSSLPSYYIKDTDKILLIRHGNFPLPQASPQTFTACHQGNAVCCNDVQASAAIRSRHCPY